MLRLFSVVLLLPLILASKVVTRTKMKPSEEITILKIVERNSEFTLPRIDRILEEILGNVVSIGYIEMAQITRGQPSF